MRLITVILLMAVTMVSSITLIMKNTTFGEEENAPIPFTSKEFENKLIMPSSRVSRFLAENKNPKAADHCMKDNEICYLQGGYNSTCCNNKCVDLWNDDKNCGACKSKCKSLQTCCNGECVYLSYDKRNCGSCGNKCKTNLCIYGLCDYA